MADSVYPDPIYWKRLVELSQSQVEVQIYFMLGLVDRIKKRNQAGLLILQAISIKLLHRISFLNFFLVDELLLL